MERARYLRKAEYFDRLAAASPNARERTLVRQIADEWRMLAEEAARLAVGAKKLG